MIERADDIDAYITALLDITGNCYIKAISLVCKDIETKNETTKINKNQQAEY